jgi:hypothetical protein
MVKLVQKLWVDNKAEFDKQKRELNKKGVLKLGQSTFRDSRYLRMFEVGTCT